MKKTSKNERGAILIAVVGILAILSLMAVTFMTNMKIEADMATNYADNAHAELIARGAVEFALASLISDNTNTPARPEFDSDSYYDDWATAFAKTGTDADDADVCDLLPGNDSKWLYILDDSSPQKAVGRFAIMILDQNMLVYANEDDITCVDRGDGTNMKHVLYNNMYGHAGTADTVSGNAFRVKEEVVLVDDDISPHYFSVFSHTITGGKAKAPWNLNTWYTFWKINKSDVGAAANLDPLKAFLNTPDSLADPATVIFALRMAMFNLSADKKAFESWTEIEDVIWEKAKAGTITEQCANDALNCLIRFDSQGSQDKGLATNMHQANESTYHWVSDDPTGAGATDFTDDHSHATGDICLKSYYFQVWGMAETGLDSNGDGEIEDSEVIGLPRKFLAIVDRGITTGDTAAIKMFRWRK